ncbi:sorbosone dehydrogenase family protein [Nocardiopsis sp. NRRL B-16309]|uniref:PQQ-dependent sugar dehydrogenase n=1 Tax=Nocardiopsis sp. NRRL B-16309 TaxID=1519494 RepID=UPI0006AF76E3|nr:PQQ-dependent sugar dehydrogenase [Nocardiopsis sp. NRRL B-16309]KOX13996.1 glucose sorbosone dehydrogenase [Nocardiopsis sp. NRRL B-16309]
MALHGHRSGAAAALGVLLLACACADDGTGTSAAPGEPGSPGPENTEQEAQGAGSGEPGEPGEPTDLATGLEVPWGVGFLPDGSALVTERDSAEVEHVAADGTVTGAGRVEGVVPGGEGGLLGLAMDPEFPEDPYVYVYYTARSDNRISRIEYDADENELGEADVILDGLPKAGNHNGGRIAFGPDDLLYVGTGDAAQGALAQDTDSLAGKILRITDDGEPAEGNPFDNRVYSYGHRNVQGLAWDADGRLYATEFGSDERDEINLIEPGANYGWPEVEGPGGGDEYTDPLLTWSPAEASPSGAAIAGGALWVAALRGERLWRVPLDGEGGLGEPESSYEGDYGRLRTVVTEPGGGALWLTTSNLDGRGSPQEGDDRILRVPLE